MNDLDFERASKLDDVVIELEEAINLLSIYSEHADEETQCYQKLSFEKRQELAMCYVNRLPMLDALLYSAWKKISAQKEIIEQISESFYSKKDE